MSNKIIQNIVGGSRSSDIVKVCRAMSDNLYVETLDSSQASSSSMLRSIRGTELAMMMPEAPCRGLYRASRGYEGNPVMFGCFGVGIYIIYTPSATGVISYAKVGTVSRTGNTPVHFCETGGEGSAHPHLICTDGASVFAVQSDLDPFALADDWRAISLPLRVGSTSQKITPTHCAYLYGYLIVNDAGTDAFYTSYHYPFETTLSDGSIDYDIFQLATYDGYGFVTYSEWMPDNTTALICTGSHLWTFGPRSFQIFSYNNDTNYPFTSPDNAAAAVGIKAVDSVATVGDMVFWYASSDIGENGIYMGQGVESTRISTPDLEREVASFSYPQDAVGQSWQENQHVFYSITFLTDKRTFVYDVGEKVWHNRSSYLYGYWRPQFATLYEGKIFFGERDSRALCYMAKKWNEWDGKVIIRKRVGGVATADFSPFYIESLRLVCNNGQVPERTPALKPQVMARFSWDGGTTWSDAELGCLGEIGQYQFHTDFWHLGSGDIFTAEFSVSDDVDFSIISAKIDASACNVF